MAWGEKERNSLLPWDRQFHELLEALIELIWRATLVDLII